MYDGLEERIVCQRCVFELTFEISFARENINLPISISIYKHIQHHTACMLCNSISHYYFTRP